MIEYKTGNVLEPEETPAVIVQCCNNKKIWGAGVAKQIKQKWPHAYQKHLEDSNELGTIGICVLEPKLYLCNIIGQVGYGLDQFGKPPIRYDAIYNGLEKLSDKVKNKPDMTVVMPKMGAGYAMGHWEIIEAIINCTLINRGIKVVVYTLS